MRQRRNIRLSLLIAFVLSLCLMVFLPFGIRVASDRGAAREGTDVQIQLSEYTIHSSVTTFSRGVSYHFVVKNSGAQNHELMLMPKMKGNMQGMSMQQMHRMDFFDIDLISPGETTLRDYTFPEGESVGVIEFSCHMANHYMEGMHLDMLLQ